MGTDLNVVKPARVSITYLIETGQEIETRELPFVVGVLADLSGRPKEPLPNLKDGRRRFIEIDRDVFDNVMRGIRPRLAWNVENKLADDDTKLHIELLFESMADFEPRQVIEQIAPLRRLLRLRVELAALLAKTDGNERLREKLRELVSNTELLRAISKEAGIEQERGDEGIPDEADTATEAREFNLLDQIITESRIGWDDLEHEASRRQIAALVEEVMNGTLRIANDLDGSISARISDIDRLISRQLNEVLHAPEFQSLEGAWRGLYYLVSVIAGSPTLKIRILNVSKDELARDQERAGEFEQSALYKKVYQEYETFDGKPYSALIGDFYFSRHATDMRLLEKLSNVAARVHAPFISAASPSLFNWDGFLELDRPRDLAKIFETPEYATWKGFRESEDARYVALVLPRVLLRAPYSPDNLPSLEFAFAEDVDGTDHMKYLWGNAAYAFAVRMAVAFHWYGWCARIRGGETGGLVRGLPQHTFLTDHGSAGLKCPTEIAISDKRRKELTVLGFIALSHEKHSDRAIFFSTPSCARPKKYDTDKATAVAHLAVRLEYIMTVSLFAHYFKVILRDKVGDFASRRDCEVYLNQWVAQYVQAEDVSTEETKARFPLRYARVEVIEGPGAPRSYRALAFLEPQFQLTPLAIPLKLVIELPAQANR
jgi:type VI secretion system protein ImpC